MTSKRSQNPRHDDPAASEAIGRAIKVVRTAAGLNRRDLAGQAGISYPYLSEIESGTKAGSPRVLRAIAEALGVPLHELLAAAETLPPVSDEHAAEMRTVHRDDRSSWFRAASPAFLATEARAQDRGGREALLAQLGRLVESLPEDDLARLIDLARRMAQ